MMTHTTKGPDCPGEETWGTQVLASGTSIAADFETLAIYRTLRRKRRRASPSFPPPRLWRPMIQLHVQWWIFIFIYVFLAHVSGWIFIFYILDILIMKVDVFMLSGTSRISQDFIIKTSLLISQKSSKTEAWDVPKVGVFASCVCIWEPGVAAQILAFFWDKLVLSSPMHTSWASCLRPLHGCVLSPS